MILYILSMLWALFALCAFLYVLHHPQKFEKISSPLLLLVTAGLCLRIIPAFVLVPVSNYDIESYRLVSQHVLAFEDVYTAQDTVRRHPYLPLQMYWMGFSQFLSSQTHPPFTSIVRLAPITADILISLVIFFTTGRRFKRYPPLWAALLYALNPLSIYVSAFHGQFDAIPALFILLAIRSANNQAPGSSGFWLGLGILVKSWPVLAFPSLFLFFRNTKQKILFLILSGLVPVLGILVYSWLYDARILTVIKRALTYNNQGIGSWGYTYLLRMVGLFWSDALPFVNSYFSVAKYVTVLGLFVIWFFVARKQDLFARMLTILVALMAFFHAFSIQYLIWLLPFAILNNQIRWLKWYTLAAFSYMFLTYHTLILRDTITQFMSVSQADVYLITPTSLPAWLITLAWLWNLVRANRGMPEQSLSTSPLDYVAKS